MWFHLCKCEYAALMRWHPMKNGLGTDILQSRNLIMEFYGDLCHLLQMFELGRSGGILVGFPFRIPRSVFNWQLSINISLESIVGGEASSKATLCILNLPFPVSLGRTLAQQQAVSTRCIPMPPAIALCSNQSEFSSFGNGQGTFGRV